MQSDNESISDRGDGEILSDTPLEETEVTEAPVEGEEPQTEDKKNDSEDESKRKVVKPKRVMKPQPKFNEQTIKNAKGLPAVRQHFKDIKYKGKGYEEHDLNIILKTYEYWSHRFFPKYTFSDSIARLEVLGTKKSTMTYLKRIRLGIDDYNIEEDKPVLSDEEVPTTGFVEPVNDQFDQIMGTSRHEPEPDFTEEQLERMKQNKLRAEELRKKYLSKIGQLNQTVDVNSSMNLSQNQSVIEETTSKDIDAGQNTPMEGTADEELDLDSMLNMLNEDEEPGTNKVVAVLRKNNETMISNAIRSARFESLLDNDNSNSQEQQNAIDENQSNQNSNKESDYSDAESVVLNKTASQKKKQKRARNQRKYVQANKEMSESSDDELVKAESQNGSNKEKKKRVVAGSDKDLNPITPSNFNNAKKRSFLSDEDSDHLVIISQQSEINNHSDDSDSISEKSKDKEGTNNNKEVIHDQNGSTKEKKKRRIIQSDEDSDDRNTSQKDSDQDSASISQYFTKNNASITSRQRSSTRNSISQQLNTSTLRERKKSEGTLSADKNEKSDGSIKEKKKRRIIQSDEDSDDRSTSQFSKSSVEKDSDQESRTISQFSTKNGGSITSSQRSSNKQIHSDEDSDSTRNMISQHSNSSTLRKRKNLEDTSGAHKNKESDGLIKEKKKRRIIQSDEDSDDRNTSQFSKSSVGKDSDQESRTTISQYSTKNDGSITSSQTSSNIRIQSDEDELSSTRNTISQQLNNSTLRETKNLEGISSAHKNEESEEPSTSRKSILAGDSESDESNETLKNKNDSASLNRSNNRAIIDSDEENDADIINTVVTKNDNTVRVKRAIIESEDESNDFIDGKEIDEVQNKSDKLVTKSVMPSKKKNVILSDEDN